MSWSCGRLRFASRSRSGLRAATSSGGSWPTTARTGSRTRSPGWTARRRSCTPTAGRAFRYDALLVAVGGRQIEAFEHVTTFRDAEADETYQGVVQDVEQGYSKRIVFLLPDGPV